MPANLDFETLKAAVASGEIDTVMVALVDMQGRLMGKRFHAAHFIENPDETHCCNYLLATDLEMETVQGYRATSWASGYGDYVMKPDLTTLRRIPWAPATVLCMADLYDHRTHEPVPHAPRNILRSQIERARAMGFEPMMATELEFFLFTKGYKELFDADYRGLVPTARFNVDYGLTGTFAEEPFMRALRNGLYGAGIPVENTKGEAEAGQHEVNVKYSDAMDTADMHVIVKSATKEIAQNQGLSATFMAKYAHGKAGSSSHVHQSLFRDGVNVFHDAGAEHGMSDLMRHYMAGQLAHAAELTYFLAPYVNSYKRFVTGLFAPTKAIWSIDNRTAGFRVCGDNTRGVRVECRIGGADLNPYLACAALLAAGLAGIEQKLELEPAFSGDAYAAEQARQIPKTLGTAAMALNGSTMLRAAFGDEVVDHYLRAAEWELEEQNRVVTDWELSRGFERA
ncbi:glutamine synthetase family protein [Paracoccus sp. PAR01]|uniref:glutamine synthetase family protein n=1 Tax=Paracoccus sp. PAR01 TaxID=2769282 RepID=UPI001786FA52|nr:glutamine synthetase family protein [Paracoccus sp. PAR01]MBD9528847.1 glutamine synthetase [Paracoccus sp. PAR01]